MDPPPADRAGGLLGGPGLTARLDRWLADARADEAIAGRAREHWLVFQAEQSATFAGVLLDLAERRTHVVVHGVGGRRHRGTVSAVARDFAIVRLASGRDVLLVHQRVMSVRPDPGAVAPLGDRVVTADTTVGEFLAEIAADRPRALVLTVDGEGIAGELRSVGEDVVTVRLDGSGGTAYVPVAGIAEVSLPEG